MLTLAAAYLSLFVINMPLPKCFFVFYLLIYLLLNAAQRESFSPGRPKVAVIGFHHWVKFCIGPTGGLSAKR